MNDCPDRVLGGRMPVVAILRHSMMVCKRKHRGGGLEIISPPPLRRPPRVPRPPAMTTGERACMCVRVRAH